MPLHPVVWIDSAQDAVALVNEHSPDGGRGGGGTDKIDNSTAPQRTQARTDHDKAAQSSFLRRESCEATRRERGRACKMAQGACERGEERGALKRIRC